MTIQENVSRIITDENTIFGSLIRIYLNASILDSNNGNIINTLESDYEFIFDNEKSIIGLSFNDNNDFFPIQATNPLPSSSLDLIDNTTGPWFLINNENNNQIIVENPEISVINATYNLYLQTNNINSGNDDLFIYSLRLPLSYSIPGFNTTITTIQFHLDRFDNLDKIEFIITVGNFSDTIITLPE